MLPHHDFLSFDNYPALPSDSEPTDKSEMDIKQVNKTDCLSGCCNISGYLKEMWPVRVMQRTWVLPGWFLPFILSLVMLLDLFLVGLVSLLHVGPYLCYINLKLYYY